MQYIIDVYNFISWTAAPRNVCSLLTLHKFSELVDWHILILNIVYFLAFDFCLAYIVLFIDCLTIASFLTLLLPDNICISTRSIIRDFH